MIPQKPRKTNRTNAYPFDDREVAFQRSVNWMLFQIKGIKGNLLHQASEMYKRERARENPVKAGSIEWERLRNAHLAIDKAVSELMSAQYELKQFNEMKKRNSKKSGLNQNLPIASNKASPE